MFLKNFPKIEARLVLKMFLNLRQIWASRSYKLSSYKKKRVTKKLKGQSLTCAKRRTIKFDPIKAVLLMKFRSLDWVMVILWKCLGFLLSLGTLQIVKWLMHFVSAISTPHLTIERNVFEYFYFVLYLETQRKNKKNAANTRTSLTEFRHQMRSGVWLAYLSLNCLFNGIVWCFWCYLTDGRTDGQTHPLVEMRERI